MQRNVKRTCFMVKIGPFRRKFYGNGVIPCQKFDSVRWIVALELCRWKFLDNGTVKCSRLLYVFVEISAKNDKFGYVSPILGS